MKNINSAMESGDEKRGESALSNHQILKFNLLIINVLIFY
jgi:hypothetical protein